MIIRYPASLLILFRKLLKTAAILLPLVQMIWPFIISKIWAPMDFNTSTHIYNLSIKHGNITATWEHAIITPAPKPYKLADLGTSYPPISLFCTAKTPSATVTSTHYLSPNQHSFRPNYYTVSAFLLLAHKIAQGFNQTGPPLRTLIKTIDLTKLILALTLSSLSNNFKRWLSTY